MEPIAYFSKKYTLAETRWAPYVREAYALTWALSKSKDFVQAAQETPIVFIDQKPLLWLSSARSPKVVRWVVEILQELDYKLVYRPGPEHLGADAFSRVLCVSSGVPTDVGITVAIQRLLDVLVLPDRHAPRHVLWLSICGRDTELLQSLRQRNRKILVSATTTQALEATYDYAILIPDSTRAPVVARHLLRDIKPFAILLPTDLVHLTYSPLGGSDIETVDELARSKLRETKKLVFMEDNLTWIVSPNWPGVFETAVYSVELFESSGGVAESIKRALCYGMFFSPYVQRTLEAYIGDGLAEGLAPDLRRLRKPPTRDKILHAQRMDPTSIAWLTQLNQGEKVEHSNGEIKQAPDGVLVFQSSEDIESLDSCPAYIPPDWQRDIIFYCHRQKNHARESRLSEYLSRGYWWPTLQEDVKKALMNCHFCLVARARSTMRHTEYSSMKMEGPHQGYGLDIWGPTVESEEGYRFILTMVDLFHGYVRYFPVRTKSTFEIMSVCLNMVWWHSGLPSFVLTDDDSAFRASLFTEFCRLTNVETWRTAPYSSWELGRVERRHKDLNLGMQALRDKSLWPHHLPGPIAHASNTLVSSVTSMSGRGGVRLSSSWSS